MFVLPEDVSVSVQLNFPFVTVTVPVEKLEETPVIRIRLIKRMLMLKVVHQFHNIFFFHALERAL